MKTLFPILIIIFLVIPLESVAQNRANNPPKKYAVNKPSKHIKFKCDGRQHCSQMRSYQEAKYFIKHCPNTKMDGDDDGIPCEGYKKR